MKHRFDYTILIFIVIALAIIIYLNYGIFYDAWYYLTKPALPRAVRYLQQKLEMVEDLAFVEAIATSTEPGEYYLNVTPDIIKNLPQPMAQEINLAVPFQPQAPFGNWSEPYQDACEEAAMIMVDHYLRGVGLSKQEMKDEIDQRIAWETKNWGYEKNLSKNLSIEKVRAVINAFYSYKATIISDLTIDKIKLELNLGRPVIVPTDARLLLNPNYTPPGPIYHVIVIKGYTASGWFITNDPGTHLGADFLYKESVLMPAIHDWDGTKPAGPQIGLVMYE